jgi:hypothetical protein
VQAYNCTCLSAISFTVYDKLKNASQVTKSDSFFRFNSQMSSQQNSEQSSRVTGVRAILITMQVDIFRHRVDLIVGLIWDAPDISLTVAQLASVSSEDS